MKFIVKATEPPELTAWKRLADENWQPTYAGLRGAEKQSVKAALMQEQGYICCYCERQLTDGDSHIEHFRPQSDPLVDPLDYANLLCSCQNKLDKGEARHCGNLKGDWFDSLLFVSPLTPDCESRFIYTADGRIYPADQDPGAGETIVKLGLDSPKLVSLRAAAISPFLDGEITEEELSLFVEGYLKKTEGHFGQFWTAIRSLFGRPAELAT